MAGAPVYPESGEEGGVEAYVGPEPVGGAVGVGLDAGAVFGVITGGAIGVVPGLFAAIGARPGAEVFFPAR